jgi:hypothetical protein
MFYYHCLMCAYAIPSFNLPKNDSKCHFGIHLCFYPVLIIVVSLLPYTGMATPQVYERAIAHITAHPELSLRTVCNMAEFRGVTKNSLSRRMDGRVLIDAKPGPRPKVTVAQGAEFKLDVQRGMHGNAMTLATAAAKLGAYASSNQVPYIDGVPCKRSVLHFFNDNDLGIAKARLMRTGRIKQYDWAKLEPAYLKLGEIFAKSGRVPSIPR